MDLGLRGKFALVTGGSHGIGLATARHLAAEGCNVAVCSRSQERLDAATKELKAFGVRTLAVAADVLEPEAADRVMDVVDRDWGELQILINNVGGGGRWGKDSIEETELRVWSEVYEKNAMAAVRFTRRALPHMRRAKWGRVVTVTSRPSRSHSSRSRGICRRNSSSVRCDGCHASPARAARRSAASRSGCRYSLCCSRRWCGPR